MTIDLLFEAAVIGRGGSEGGTSQAWIDCAIKREDLRRIVIVYAHGTEHAAELGACDPRLEFIHVPVPPTPAWWRLLRAETPQGIHSALERVAGHQVYWQWLENSAEALDRTFDPSHPCLMIHVSFASLLFGTSWRPRDRRIAKTALSGSFALPVPSGFRNEMPVSERIASSLRKPLLWASRHRRRVDFIAAGHPFTAAELASERLKTSIIRDPLIPLEYSPVKLPGSVLFVDTANTPRKGSTIVRKLVDVARASHFRNVTLQIATKRPNYWRANLSSDRVHVLPWMPEEEFTILLRNTEFILSASWREGRGTSIIRAATAGAIPIVPDSLVFDDIPEDGALKYDCSADVLASLLEAIERVDAMQQDERKKMRTAVAEWARSAASHDAISKVLDDWIAAAGRLSIAQK